MHQAFAIPEHISLMAVIAVGHQAAPNSLEEELRQREIAPRQRQPIGSLCFEDSWEKPWQR